jgi:hypothetical protein
MSSRTRISRFPSEPGPMQSGLRTVVFGAAAPAPNPGPGEAWFRLHRLMRSACLEETRPGLFIFAALRDVAVGRLWLAATDAPRAGTLGRHEATDLPLTPEAALSLRHALFVVRLVAGRVRFCALDLETPGGLHTRHGAQRLTESERPALLRTAGLTFFCVPTGPGSVLPIDPLDARRVFDDTPKSKRTSCSDQLRLGNGVLTLRLDEHVLPLSVDVPMLSRGVLLGRQERCDVIIPDPQVSRVHAVVLNVDGEAHLVDTGSSNGTWHAAGRVKCRKLEHGDVFMLGRATVEWRRC